LKEKVKYGVRSPKFIWAPCTQLYSLTPLIYSFLSISEEIRVGVRYIHKTEQYTDKKEDQIFLIFRKFRVEEMRKCANISPYMRRPLVILNFLMYEENLIFCFISVLYLRDMRAKQPRPLLRPRQGL
jgi:hypothetical protein